MVFDNLDQVVAYIQKTVTDELPALGEEMRKIMHETLMMETGYEERIPNMYDRTGGMENICEYEQIGDKEIDGVFRDNGKWVNKHGSHYFPLNRWEEGTVWAPGYSDTNPVFYPATNIEEDARNEIDVKIPLELKEKLRIRGLNVL